MVLLIEAYGGLRIPIPARAPTERSALTKKVGFETATVLYRLYPNQLLTIPLARWFRVRVLRKAGCSYSQIASRLGMTERTVYQHVKDGALVGRVSKSKAGEAAAVAPKVLP